MPRAGARCSPACGASNQGQCVISPVKGTWFEQDSRIAGPTFTVGSRRDRIRVQHPTVSGRFAAGRPKMQLSRRQALAGLSASCTMSVMAPAARGVAPLSQDAARALIEEAESLHDLGRYDEAFALCHRVLLQFVPTSELGAKAYVRIALWIHYFRCEGKPVSDVWEGYKHTGTEWLRINVFDPHYYAHASDEDLVRFRRSSRVRSDRAAALWQPR